MPTYWKSPDGDYYLNLDRFVSIIIDQDGRDSFSIKGFLETIQEDAADTADYEHTFFYLAADHDREECERYMEDIMKTARGQIK